MGALERRAGAALRTLSGRSLSCPTGWLHSQEMDKKGHLYTGEEGRRELWHWLCFFQGCYCK